MFLFCAIMFLSHLEHVLIIKSSANTRDWRLETVSPRLAWQCEHYRPGQLTPICLYNVYCL